MCYLTLNYMYIGNFRVYSVPHVDTINVIS